MSGSLKIAAVCCTYKRPEALRNLLGCFLAQDYENRELVILDDAGQYDDQRGDRWRLVSVPDRYPTLGEKRNAAAALVSDDVDAMAVWDDDDVYLPWALSACVAGLKQARWVRPGKILIARGGVLRQYKTWNGDSRCKLFHASWAFDRKLFHEMHGYGKVSNGEDQAFAKRLVMYGVKDADPLALGYRPYAVISWDHVPEGVAPKLSWMEAGSWKRLAELPSPYIPGMIDAKEPDWFDYRSPEILPQEFPRPF